MAVVAKHVSDIGINIQQQGFDVISNHKHVSCIQQKLHWLSSPFGLALLIKRSTMAVMLTWAGLLFGVA